MKFQTCVRVVWMLLLTLCATQVVARDAGARSFWTFETGQVRPLALSPDGARLFAVNTPDNRLEIFDVTGSGILHRQSIPVGMEPLAVAARNNDEVWVINHLSDSASIVDVSTSPARVVRTLLLCDEPRDIVFAGTGGNRAFITTARRGQNCPVAPLLTTEGIGRAIVQVFDANNLGAAPGGASIADVVLFTDTPRALAVSADGSLVYAAGFHTGNQTVVVSEGAVCDGGSTASACNLPDGIHVSGGLPGSQVPGGLPAPNDNHNGVTGPEVGLIVKFDPSDSIWKDELGRNWNNAVRFDLPDLDVFEIDAVNAPAVLRSFPSVGTILFNMIVNPANDKLYVSNTEAINEVRFEGPGDHAGPEKPVGEPVSVIGHLHESRVAVIDPAGTVATRHLNKHIDYDNFPAPQATEDASLATPVGMALNGSNLYVAAFGSSKLGVFDTAALEGDTFVPSDANHIDVTGGGPSGVVVDAANDRLYVLTRFDNGVSVIDISQDPVGTEVDHQMLPNPEPSVVVDGRPVLYDARLTGANGEASCSSCHVFGDFDSLSWDLGDPDGDVTNNPNPFGPVGSGVPFHPNKGPMTTQSLRGMDNHGPMHWRGDRTGGNFNPPMDPLDERLAFIAFNGAFPGLIGNDVQLPDATMEAFADFILEVTYPPNPIRALDNSLSASAANGNDIWFNRPNTDIIATCDECHTTSVSQGFFGTDGKSTFENETQEFKIPHIRNMYQKVGMFGMPEVAFGGSNGDFSHTGDQVRGVGFLHDGSFDTIFRFHNATVFTNMTQQDRRDIEQFQFEFASNMAPIVGQQMTLDDPNDSDATDRINLLIARAEVDRALWIDPNAHECDLIAKGVIGGEARGYVYDPDADLFVPDKVAEAGIAAGDLYQLASGGQELTFTCTPPGSGLRMGIDRDLNGILDGDEGLVFTTDHYMTYKVRRTPGSTKFQRVDVTVDDPTFGENRTLTAVRPTALALPADKNGEGTLDDVTHLESYRVRRASGTAKHVKQTVAVTNQFGATLIETQKEDRLLVPTEKDLLNPIPNPLNPASVDHFLCYKVKRPSGFAKIEGVSVADQFEDRLYDLVRPRLLCNAADKNSEGIINPDAHLLCYQAKRASGAAKHTKVEGIHVHTQFGPEQLNSRIEELLCVPSEVQ